MQIGYGGAHKVSEHSGVVRAGIDIQSFDRMVVTRKISRKRSSRRADGTEIADRSYIVGQREVFSRKALRSYSRIVAVQARSQRRQRF